MILNSHELTKQIKSWQNQHHKIVLVTGVFDILHIEHIRFLQKAKLEGDYLLVGIETDMRVKKIKGPDRPINTEVIRAEQLAALKSVDGVFYLPETFSSQTDWESFMETLHPDTYAVSSHTLHQENKQYICQKYGVNFKVVHQHNQSISSTHLINTTTSRK